MSISSGTIIRTATLGLALGNQVLSIAGKSPLPISDEQVEQVISLGFTIVASLWAWWKNNSYTAEAIKADELLEELRAGEVE